MSNTLNIHLFQTGPQSEASGSGTLVLTKGSGSSYSATADINVMGLGQTKTQLSGSSVTAGGNTVIALASPDGYTLKLTLVQNPYVGSKPSFGGSGAVQSSGSTNGYLYNVTVT